MRKIMALVLMASLLNCNVNIVSDLSLQDSDSSADSTESSEEIENKSIISSEVLDEEDISNGMEVTEEVIILSTEEISQDNTEFAEEDTTTVISDELEETAEEQDQATTVPEEKENESEEVDSTTMPEESEEKENELEEADATTAPNEIVENNTEFEEESQVPVSETVKDDSSLCSASEEIYNVSFPTSTKAYLDPGNLSGNGQIFSEQYIVENYGNTNVVVRIHNIEIESRSRENEYEFSRDEIIENHSKEKRLNINMVWMNDGDNEEKILNVIEATTDEDVLVLKAAEYGENGEFVGLRENSIGRFYFTGTLNTNTDIEWKDNDIVVRFDYELIYTREEDCVTDASEEKTNTKTEEERNSENLTQEITDSECEEQENQTLTVQERETEIATESEMRSAEEKVVSNNL